MRRFYTYALVIVFILAIVLLVEGGIPVGVSPQISKVSYNESLPPNWVGMDESLRANFSGHFYVVVNRHFGRIIIWVTPSEGARTEHISVKIKRKFMNAFYMEVQPPWYGRIEIKRLNNRNKMEYLIRVTDLGEAGKSTYELQFIDRAPEEMLSFIITVETREGLFRYRGELPVVIPEPFYNCTFTPLDR